MELTPKTRKETFLAAAGGQDLTTPTPVTREEVFLDAIAKGGGGGGSSGGGVLVVNMVDDYTDKTWKEIHDAPMAVIVQDGGSFKFTGPVLHVGYNSNEYSMIFCSYMPNGNITSTKLVTDSENGYLTWAE